MTKDYTLTFGATTVQLSTVLDASDTSHTSARWMSLQADPGNSHVIYVGGSNHRIDVGSANYGIIIPIPVTNIPAVPITIPFSPAQALDLSEFWVNGTSTEKLHIFLIF